MRSNVRTAARFPLLAALLMVCLLAGHAQTSPAARVIALDGQVSVLRDGAPWALSVGSAVQPKQIIITGPDGSASFQVSDGSTFQVFPNSQVIFRQTPSNWTQLLDVLIGRVKVYIQKLGNQPNPNSVYTNTAVISVRGTIFDVAVEDDAGTTFVSVDEGLVEVANRTSPGGGTKMLSPGDSIRVLKNVPLAKTVVDKNSVFRGIMNGAAQAMQEILWRASRGGSPGGTGTGGGTGTIGQGDKQKPQPPPTAPPQPPPPPPTPPPPPPAPPQ